MYSVRSRRKKAAVLVKLIAESDVRSVLLIGVESADFAWSNVVEEAIAGTGVWVVATGLGPVVRFGDSQVVCDGRRLPFGEKTFDLAVSNAVVEHVGDETDQQAFVDEHHRVAARFVMTTPNLWFPVESHARVLFRHWSGRWRADHRDIVTRLLTKRSFLHLLPKAGTVVEGHLWSPKFLAVHNCTVADCLQR